MGSETEGSERGSERAILSLTYNLARGHRGHSHAFYSVVEENGTLKVKYPLKGQVPEMPLNLPVP